eukprot:1157888-Pelagomonas_calceolata.AAC.12
MFVHLLQVPSLWAWRASTRAQTPTILCFSDLPAPLPCAPTADGPGPIPVGLGGEHQRTNAALAVQLCAKFEARRLASGNAAPGAGSRLELLQEGKLPAQYGQGLRDTSWLGRSTVRDPQCICVLLCVIQCLAGVVGAEQAPFVVGADGARRIMQHGVYANCATQRLEHRGAATVQPSVAAQRFSSRHIIKAVCRKTC